MINIHNTPPITDSKTPATKKASKTRRRRHVLPDHAQRKPAPLASVFALVAQLHREDRQAPSVLAGLWTMTDERRTTQLPASRLQIAQSCGLVTNGLGNISRALGVLERGGRIRRRSVRVLKAIRSDGKYETGITELLTICLNLGDDPVGNISLFEHRRATKDLPDCSTVQQSLPDVVTTDKNAVAVWYALCSLANKNGMLTINVDKKGIRDLAGLTDSTLRQTQKAIDVLRDAHWIERVRQGGRRGNKVVPSQFRLILGTTTRLIAPLSALGYLVPVPHGRKKNRRPTSPTCKSGVRELLRSNKSLKATAKSTATTRNRSPNARAGARVLCFSIGDPVSVLQDHQFIAVPEPTSEPELMRPQILNEDLCFAFDLSVPVSERINALDRQLKELSAIRNYALNVTDRIDSLADPVNKHSRRFSTSKWKRFRNCHADWAEEALDCASVVECVRLALTNDPDPQTRQDDDVIRFKRIQKKLLKRLRARTANRGNRYIYFRGMYLLKAALSLVASGPEEASSVLKNDNDFVGLDRGSKSPGPRFTPRYFDFNKGWCFDMGRARNATYRDGRRYVRVGWTASYNYALDGRPVDLDALVGAKDLNTLSTAFKYGLHLPNLAAKWYRANALKRLSKLSLRALSQCQDRLGMKAPFVDGHPEYALLDLLRECFENRYIEPGVIVAADVAVDTSDPAANLTPAAVLYRTYRDALREYNDCGPVAMVVRKGGKLWVVHNHDHAPVDGHQRVETEAFDVGGRICFEPLDAFLDAILEAHGGRARNVGFLDLIAS